MALNSYAYLTANDTAIDGFCSQHEVGGVDTNSDAFECFQVEFGTSVGSEGRSARVNSERVLHPLVLLKRIDRSTPALQQACSQNQRIDGEIKMFETDSQTGETVHFFSLRIGNGRITRIESVDPDTLDPNNGAYPAFQRVHIRAGTLAYIDQIGSTEYEDDSTVAV